MDDPSQQTPPSAQPEDARSVGSEDQAARAGAGAPTEEELREAYAAELRRVSSAELLLQTAASLINVGAYRLGLIGGDPADRDLEQVRDAIDGVRALLPIVERSGDAQQLRPLRDALSQLQLAYAREAEAQAGTGVQSDTRAPAQEPSASTSPPDAAGASGDSGEPPAQPEGGDPRRPGPAESSGRLWVPGQG